MPEDIQNKLLELRKAAAEERWDEFASLIGKWAESDPDNPWLRAGIVVAECARGDEVDPDRAAATLEPLDMRLLNQVNIISDLRAERMNRARQRVFAEAAISDGEDVWLKALAVLDPREGEPARHLFATPHLVAGCIMRDDQVISMAVKGSRMTVDILAFQTNLIQDKLERFLKRVDIGDVKFIHVVGEDGGWVMCKTTEEPPRVAAALVAAPPMTDIAAARAQVALSTGVGA